MVMEINREDERPGVEMTARDKNDINAFSRKLARKNELKVLVERRQKLLQLHEDASDELLLMDDDDSVHYTIGDVFIMDDKEQVEANLETTKADLAKDVQGYEEEMRSLSEEMTKLKATLYAKFGKVCYATCCDSPFCGLTYLNCVYWGNVLSLPSDNRHVLLFPLLFMLLPT